MPARVEGSRWQGHFVIFTALEGTRISWLNGEVHALASPRSADPFVRSDRPEWVWWRPVLRGGSNAAHSAAGARPLSFRINDVAPSNGSGLFEVRVRV